MILIGGGTVAGFNILTVTQITAYLKSYIDENKKLPEGDNHAGK